MTDPIPVIQAFQRRADQLQAALDSIKERIENTPEVKDPEGNDLTGPWLDGEVAKLVRLHSEKIMTEDCANTWASKRL